MQAEYNGTRYRLATREDFLCAREFFDPRSIDSRGQPRCWRRNGRTKTWKRDAERIEVPVKHGLYAYDTMTKWELGVMLVRADD